MHVVGAGFNRISIGVQDLDPRVLDIVDPSHEEAPQVRETVDSARALRSPASAVDLIYGLAPADRRTASRPPWMPWTACARTRICSIPMRPCRGSSPASAGFTEADLPRARSRARQLLETGRRQDGPSAGCVEIGLDQYALTE